MLNQDCSNCTDISLFSEKKMELCHIVSDGFSKSQLLMVTHELFAGETKKEKAEMHGIFTQDAG